MNDVVATSNSECQRIMDSVDEGRQGEAAFLQGFKDAGFIEGGNIRIERRWAEGQHDRLPSLARELLGRNVVVIVAFDAPAAFAAKAATKTTPIVFLTSDDLVATGLVESFSRPGNNLTGVSVLFSGVGPKRAPMRRSNEG